MDSVAVLASGGLDSAILVSDLAQDHQVFPVYVQNGLLWEADELRSLIQFLDAVGNPNLQSVTVLSIPVNQLYGDHWSLSGVEIPNENDPDEMMYLPGRNVLLISVAAIWCVSHGIQRLALGSLLGNPFPDATPEFFEGFAHLLSVALKTKLEISTPYRGIGKHQLIDKFWHLPLELTLTCISPKNGVHCGRCNKCHERRLAFGRSKLRDLTIYVEP